MASATRGRWLNSEANRKRRRQILRTTSKSIIPGLKRRRRAQFAASSSTAATLTSTIITSVGFETRTGAQAILLAGGPGPVTIDNNYMMALGEVFMSGGLTVGILPGDLTFTRNYLEAPQKYNPWNPSVFDTSDVQGTTNLGCSLMSSGTTVTCNSHGQGVAPNTTIRVLKLTSGPQSGEIRTVSSAPTSNTLAIEQAFSANQTGVSATLYTPFTGHKNNFELKFLHGTTNLIEGNIFDGTWTMGQDGTALVLTIRSENGVLSTATIKNTTFQYNYFRRINQFMKYLTPDDSGHKRDDVFGCCQAQPDRASISILREGTPNRQSGGYK